MFWNRRRLKQIETDLKTIDIIMKALMYLVVNEYTNAVNIIEKKTTLS